MTPFLARSEPCQFRTPQPPTSVGASFIADQPSRYLAAMGHPTVTGDQNSPDLGFEEWGSCNSPLHHVTMEGEALRRP